MKPFELLPNPEFIYMSKPHKRAMSYLDYGIRERAGFILLTGEVGSGKTTIIRNLVKKHLHNVVLSKVFNTRVDSEHLLAMINDDFGLPVQNKDKITMIKELNDFLIEQFRRGNQPVLIIDEAQNLPHDLLEEIRMLSNLETDSAKLLQIILVGQPELRKTLALPSLMQLRQRISVNCHIQPLSSEETEDYILYRLEKAGDRNAVTFGENTIGFIYKYSRGIPRLINIICDFLMLSAYAEQTTTIGCDMVSDIIGDLDFDNHFWGSTPAEPEPLRGQAAAVNVADRFGEHMHRLISDINERLDSLGRKSDMVNRKIYEDLGKKISCLDHSLKSHQEATGSVLSDLLKKVTTAESGYRPVVPCTFPVGTSRDAGVKQAISS
jgi:putative secretion ATPase (PEP-CTERM system associated)